MPKFIDLTGQRFGFWVVVGPPERRNGATMWPCKCDCGTKRLVNGRSLRMGGTSSCGCRFKGKPNNRGGEWGRIENPRKANKTHGKSKTRLFRIYTGMKGRCYNQKNASYKNYGGRGIQICKEWLDDFSVFYEWAVNNGYGDNLSIDRIDAEGDYCPENCRWATRKEQANNTRQNRFLEFNGETHTVKEWADIIGISEQTIRGRLREGWNTEDVLGLPVLKPWSRAKR